MEVDIHSLVSDSAILRILVIALCAGLIGWVTNWVAIQLSFYPVEFRGPTRWLGWQGIIPSKAEKMATIVVDRSLSRLGDFSEIFRRVEPELITEQIVAKLEPRVEEIIDEIMEEKQAVLWNNLPMAVRNRVYDWARQQLPRRVEAMMADIGEQLGELIDFRYLVVHELRRNRGLMNRIFQESGAPEFRFIIRSGFWLGLILGCLQAMFWWWMDASVWTLVAGGFLVGLVTNWIALNIIFRPVEPRLVLGLRLQGLFLRRQDEVARTWSRLVANELLTVERIADAMVNGPRAARTRALMNKHIRPILESSGVFKIMTQIALGVGGYADLKSALQEKAVTISTAPFRDPNFNRDRAPIIADLIYERMAALPPRDFQDVLRPAFQEEEWQLMLMGGLLGAMAGWLQYVGLGLLS